MTGYTYKTIHLNNLHPDEGNFRFDPVENEKEAILEMLREIPTKIYNLMKSILDNGGIDPSILPNVVPYEKNSSEYVVMEGNRRITALKIIKDISIIEQSSEYHKISKLLNKYDLSVVPDSYHCTIYENKEHTYFWTYLRHAGELGGEGLLTWDTLSIDRFKYRTKQAEPNISYYIINYIKHSTSYHIENSRFATTLERVVDSSVGRQYYNVEIRDGVLVFKQDVNETITKLCLLIDNLINKSINSRNTNKVSEIENWIHRLDEQFKSMQPKGEKEQAGDKDQKESNESKEEVGSNSGTANNTEESKSDGKDSSEKQAHEFTKDSNENNKNQRTNNAAEATNKNRPKKLFEDLAFNHIDNKTSNGLIKLGTELVKLSKSQMGANYIAYPIATAMLLRAYIEQAFKFFLAKTGRWDALCGARKNSNGDPALGEILTYCRNNKKDLFIDKTQMRLFGILFDSDSTIKDFLDLNIHHPNVVTITHIELSTFSNLGISAFLNYLIK